MNILVIQQKNKNYNKSHFFHLPKFLVRNQLIIKNWNKMNLRLNKLIKNIKMKSNLLVKIFKYKIMLFK